MRVCGGVSREGKIGILHQQSNRGAQSPLDSPLIYRWGNRGSERSPSDSGRGWGWADTPGRLRDHPPCRAGRQAPRPRPVPPHRHAGSWMQSCQAQRVCSRPGRLQRQCRSRYAAFAVTEHRATSLHHLARGGLPGCKGGCPQDCGRVRLRICFSPKKCHEKLLCNIF